MICVNCLRVIKRLTKFRPKYSKFCQCNADYPNKYHFETIITGGSRIYPWDNIDKCFNIRQSNIIRCRLRDYIKKHGGEFYIRRHLAGMQVFNITKIDIPKSLTTNEL